MLLNIFGILVAIFVLSVLIAVHEAGHLLMAKWANIRVDVFSIGMGKEIWGFQYGETYYQIGRLPFGGFCAFGEEENPDDTDPRALMNSPLWARLLTIIGGSLFNVIFAFLLMTLLFQIGFSEQRYSNQVYVPPTIHNMGLSESDLDSPAYVAGLRSGDIIISIEGQPITHFAEIPTTLTYTSDLRKTITYVRGTTTNNIEVTALVNRETGLEVIGVFPVQPTIISEILEDSPAQKAGLQNGDRILAINNTNIQFFYEVQSSVSQGAPLEFLIERGKTTNTFLVTPELSSDQTWIIGVRGRLPQEINTLRKANNIFHAFQKSAEFIGSSISQIAFSITKLFSGEVDLQKNLSGPVRIISITGDVAQTMNIALIIQFMVMLSLALAVFNMMPIPGLDGGALFLQTARSIFRNNVIAEKIISWIERTGILLLLVLAALIFVNDIKNLATDNATHSTQTE